MNNQPAQEPQYGKCFVCGLLTRYTLTFSEGDTWMCYFHALIWQRWAKQ